MPNKNYLKGRRKEYKICQRLKDLDYDIVQRTAGSHSPFDIIAISLTKKEIHLVQCKPDNMPETQIKKLKEENQKLNGLFLVSFSVI